MKTLTLIPLLALFAACGVSLSETSTGEGGDGVQSQLSATTPRCGRDEAYCSATGRCYPAACLSCCMIQPPTCGKGEAYCPSTNRCYPEACLSCCLGPGPGTGCTGTPSTDSATCASSVDPNTDPALCDPALCGPSPEIATRLCDDGSIGGLTGRCLPTERGVCGWEIRSCP